MKLIYFISVLCVFQLSCSRISDQGDLEYVKIVVLKEADSLTSFNKGVGLGEYAFIDLRKDSFIYRDWSIEEAGEQFRRQIFYSTFTGKINDSSNISPILKLVQLVRRYPMGDINSSSLIEGATYCGPEYFFEYRDRQGLHYYNFVLDGNDTIEEFDSTFNYFSKFSRDINRIDSKVLNGDSIAVATLNILGRYADMEEPYIPFDCDDKIEIDKLIGTWRTLSNLASPSRRDFFRIAFFSDGTCIREYVRNGVSDFKYAAAGYGVDRKNNKIFIKSKSLLTELEVIKLTDHCLVLKDVRRNDTVRYDRL